MDEKNKSWIEKIKRKIESSTYDELKNIIIEEGKFGIYGKGNKTIYSVPSEYYYDLYYTLNETMQLRKVKSRSEDDDAINLGSSNYRKRTDYDLENFSPRTETPEQRAKRLKLEAKRRRRRKKNEKRNLKNKPNDKKKFNKSKEKAGKKVRKMIAVLLLSSVAITAGIRGVSRAYADSRYYDYVASTVEGLSDEEIAKKAESMLKEEISRATGEKVENIKFSDSWKDSSSHVATVTAGDQEYRYLEDLRGGDILGENTMDRNIYELISNMNNVAGKDRKEVINALKSSMKLNNKVTVKDGKLVESKESTNDSPEKSGDER